MGLLILGVENGVGGHTTSATVKGIGESLKVCSSTYAAMCSKDGQRWQHDLQSIWFLEFIYVVLTSIMKASIAITFLKWAKSKVHISLLWAAIILDVGICLVFCIYLLIQCVPVSYAWTFIDPTSKGKCKPFVGQLYMGYALCSVTISIDMLFLFVPFFMMKGRQISPRLKLYIYGVFGLGVLWVPFPRFHCYWTS